MCSVVFQYKSTERTVFGKCLGHVKFWLEMRKCFIILALLHQGCCLLNDPKSWKEINLIQIKLYNMVVQITATLYWSYSCLIISCLIKIGLINYKTCGCSKTNNPICFCYIYNPDVGTLKQEDHHWELNPSFNYCSHDLFCDLSSFCICLIEIVLCSYVLEKWCLENKSNPATYKQPLVWVSRTGIISAFIEDLCFILDMSTKLYNVN